MAEKNGFDLAAYLGSLDVVPKSGTGREQIVYIDLDLIDDDKENFYETKGIEELASNISLFGLMDPLRIRPDLDNPGRYKLTSGHRRRLALKLLKEEDPQKYAEVACIEDQVLQSSALQELKLIFANKDNRKYSPADLDEEAQRIEKLLYQLKEEGYEFPGRMRDHVAKAVNASKSKLSRLKVIREKLIPMWQPLYQQGKIGESVAYAMAQLEPEWQNVMYNYWSTRLNGLRQGHASNVKAVVEKVAQVDCRAHKGCKCLIPQERKKHIVALNQYDSYSCSGCCLDCSSLATCKDSCYLAAMEKERLIQKRKDEKAERKAAEKEKIAPTLEQIRGIYARWQEALKAKGLTAAEYLTACGQTYWVEDSVKEFEKYATHPEKVKAENTKLPFRRNLWLEDTKSLLEAADVLGCSIDWLLGRDVPGPGEVPGSGPEEVKPAPCAGWMTGEPEVNGRYAVLTCSPPSPKLFGDISNWGNGRWWGLMEDEVVRYWMPMPED